MYSLPAVEEQDQADGAEDLECTEGARRKQSGKGATVRYTDYDANDIRKLVSRSKQHWRTYDKSGKLRSAALSPSA